MTRAIELSGKLLSGILSIDTHIETIINRKQVQSPTVTACVNKHVTMTRAIERSRKLNAFHACFLLFV